MIVTNAAQKATSSLFQSKKNNENVRILQNDKTEKQPYFPCTEGQKQYGHLDLYTVHYCSSNLQKQQIPTMDGLPYDHNRNSRRRALSNFF